MSLFFKNCDHIYLLWHYNVHVGSWTYIKSVSSMPPPVLKAAAGNMLVVVGVGGFMNHPPRREGPCWEKDSCVQSGVTTVNRSDVISAQVKAFCKKKKNNNNTEEEEEHQPSRPDHQPASTPVSFYFYVFQRHIPPTTTHPGRRNVETGCFKNSILSSDSAAPVAPRHCAARSRNAKMAADLGELLVPYMPTIRVPRTGDRVFKSECAFSFDSPVSAAPVCRPHTARLGSARFQGRGKNVRPCFGLV